MSDFDADWLSLREPADRAARDSAVRDAVLQHVNAMSHVVIADLACGTGSMMRSLSPAITVPQHWHLLDNDQALLDVAAAAMAEHQTDDLTVQTHCVDLNRFPAGMIAIAPTLITCSAFVDLVSTDWLSRLVTYALMERIGVYVALTYNGTAQFSPKDPDDAAIIDAVNRHQLTDKGFGPALGPGAAARLSKLFSVARFRIVENNSDWKLGRKHAELQHRLLDGFATVAGDTELVAPEMAAAWLDRRKALVDKGKSRIVVGHQDIAAFPGARTGDPAAP